jgi:hypothetical protein
MLNRAEKLYILKDMTYCAFAHGEFDIPVNELDNEIAEGDQISTYYFPQANSRVSPKEALDFVQDPTNQDLARTIAERVNPFVQAELEKEVPQD